MPTLRQPFSFGAAGSLANALRGVLDEALMLAEALLSPNRIIAEVEQMRALQVAADDIEATDPARARMLRARASRIGLR